MNCAALIPVIFLMTIAEMKGGAIAMHTNKLDITPKYEYDKDRIREDADTVTVAREIGMNINEQDVVSGRKNIGILCPDQNHVDQHFGNCYIKPNGQYICQSCCASGDVFDLVMRFCKVSFYDALEIVADICGGRERYQLNNKDNIPRHRRYPLTQKECELIGLYNTKVYSSVRTTMNPRDLKKGERLNILDCNEDEIPIYLVERCVDKNPLMTLMMEDYECYYRLVTEKAKETIQFAKQQISILSKVKDGELFMPMYRQEIKNIERIMLKHFPKRQWSISQAA